MSQSPLQFYVRAFILCIAMFFVLFSGYTQFILGSYWSFIQNVNLIFHEAGHVLFIFFGHFLYVLGGSLVEIIIPLTVSLYFYLRKEFGSAGFGFWWLSTALMSVSVYARDAQLRQLPLITGDPDSHDWAELLRILDLLEYDQVVGDIFLILSMSSLILALIMLAQALRTTYETYSLTDTKTGNP